VDLAPDNVQVNAILPGWYRTESTAGFVDTALGEKIRQLTPAKRWGEGRDVADVAVFLASPASNFVTGAALAVDGGFTITGGLMAEDWAPLL
jgi:2-deoxy-D-gluconate 3-dehydrogenase